MLFGEVKPPRHAQRGTSACALTLRGRVFSSNISLRSTAQSPVIRSLPPGRTSAYMMGQNSDAEPRPMEAWILGVECGTSDATMSRYTGLWPAWLTHSCPVATSVALNHQSFGDAVSARIAVHQASLPYSSRRQGLRSASSLLGHGSVEAALLISPGGDALDGGAALSFQRRPGLDHGPRPRRLVGMATPDRSLECRNASSPIVRAEVEIVDPPAIGRAFSTTIDLC